MKINIVSIPVRDQERAKAFYLAIGFDLVTEQPMGPDRKWVQLAPKGGGVHITLVHWFDQMPPGSQQGLVVVVADIEAERDALLQKGVEVSAIDRTPWGAMAPFKDVDGNGWVLHEQTADETTA